jgi:hypothetical protein
MGCFELRITEFCFEHVLVVWGEGILVSFPLRGNSYTSLEKKTKRRGVVCCEVVMCSFFMLVF